MPALRSSAPALPTALFILLGACSGEIVGSPAGSSGAAPSGPAAPGDPAAAPTVTDPLTGAHGDPGRVTLHRLNRVEYNNTVRDLLGTTLTPADDFPPDDRGSGFDNVADVLSLSPLHLSMYQSAAAALVGDGLSGTLRQNVVRCDVGSEGASCAERTLRAFARRAYRRPVSDAEVARLMTLVSLATSRGDDVEAGLRLALQAVLLSPHFLFRVELDPGAAPHALSPHELATRLSYFLWSTMPDDELAAAADDGTLVQPEVLRAQVARMLASDKAKSLVANFAGQWLFTRKVDEVTPDAARFPSFDPALRSAMKRETELLFEEIAFRGLPADQLLSADFTFVNDRLAKHYGLAPVGSSAFERVTLSTAQRGGVLSHAGVLMVNSHTTSTSPVLRGKWVLGQLLCQEVPPPPPGVDTRLPNTGQATGTLRQRLEQHRADPACAGCHTLMDPIGFGLENYDAIGAYRSSDGSSPIDASGELPDGTPFSGPKELARLVADDVRFPRCVADKLFTYALGRPPDRSPGGLDEPTLSALVARFQLDFDFAGLVEGIATSAPFTMRSGEPAAGAKP